MGNLEGCDREALLQSRSLFRDAHVEESHWELAQVRRPSGQSLSRHKGRV